MIKRWVIYILGIVCGLGLVLDVSAQESFQIVLPGDTWTALSVRYGTDVQALNLHMNQQRQPTIGTEIVVPQVDREQMGKVVRTGNGGLLETAVLNQTSPWAIALQNDLSHPYQPTFHQPLFLPGGETPPRDLPASFDSLELSQMVAHPGQALGFRIETRVPVSVTAVLDDLSFVVTENGRYQVGLMGTGAFYGSGEPELAIQVDGQPLWTQPWRFEDPNTWDYQEITYTGEAAEIDQAAIDEERARLRELWSQMSPAPLWQNSFREPLDDYLEISSTFGARRSTNGGPYNRYHEGVDFSAYGGTPVLAPAGGTVVVAEPLYVRGGAVIIDHGLGVYSGYYHLSDIFVEIGTAVSPGDSIGAVGTTGLSTGNHLHWDLLIGTTWVDVSAWLDQDMACWILEGWGQPCVDFN